MNSNSNNNKICVVYCPKRKKFLFLHVVISSRGKPYYYFSSKEEGAIPLPEGFEVVISKRSNYPFLRKKR